MFSFAFWFGMTRLSLRRHAKLIKREVAAGRRVFVSQLVLLETEWVLRSRYSLPKNLIIEAISGLLDATDVRFEDEPAIEEALFIWKDTTADFADCLIGAQKPTAWMSSDGNLRCEGFQVAGVYSRLTIVGGAVVVTSRLLEAFLACPVKCHLAGQGGSPSGHRILSMGRHEGGILPVLRVFKSLPPKRRPWTSRLPNRAFVTFLISHFRVFLTAVQDRLQNSAAHQLNPTLPLA